MKSHFLKALVLLSSLVALIAPVSLFAQSITGSMWSAPSYRVSNGELINTNFGKLQIEANNLPAGEDLCWKAVYTLGARDTQNSRSGCVSRYVLDDLSAATPQEWSGDSGTYTWDGGLYSWESNQPSSVSSKGQTWICSDTLVLSLYYGSSYTDTEMVAQSSYSADCEDYSPTLIVSSPSVDDVAGHQSFNSGFGAQCSGLIKPDTI